MEFRHLPATGLFFAADYSGKACLTSMSVMIGDVSIVLPNPLLAFHLWVEGKNKIYQETSVSRLVRLSLRLNSNNKC